MTEKMHYCDTKKAAEFLGCSVRRVRKLLADGRITGKKVDDAWQIKWPLQCTFGLRAPLRKFSQHGNKTKTVVVADESEG